jgi:two-component SAPR family response regulator
VDASQHRTTALKGYRVLVVEDQFLLAEEICAIIGRLGGEVVGPFATPKASLQWLAETTVDLAILDINLDGEEVYGVAEELQRRNIPFFFATGYDPWVVWPQFKYALHLEKPVNSSSLIQAIDQLHRPSAGSKP